MVTALILSSNVFASEKRHLSCTFKLMTKSDYTLVALSCDQGNFELYGLNNSPCKGSDLLSAFFDGAAPNEVVEIDGLIYNSVSLGGEKTNFDVIFATRENSSEVLEAPTIMRKGVPKKCNTTHVDILRR